MNRRRTTIQLQRRATEWLTLATVFWGLSFPVMKAIGMAQQGILPGRSSWFMSASTLVVRFGVAGLLMLAWSWRTLPKLTWLEFWEGLGLGLFSGAGMLLQVDGLAYTSASSSAFLTQAYCLLLPVAVAWREKRAPSLLIVTCSAMVVAGVAILADADWRNLHLGRGELETLLSSLLFAGQILWLERPLFARNQVRHFTMVMFLVMAGVSVPVAFGSMTAGVDWLNVYRCGPVLILMTALIFLCTLVAFVLMNHWQPVLPAPEAALIYAAEPVFASLFALFLPAGLSRFAGIRYENETVTWSLLWGGGLITLANVLVQWRALRTSR